MLPVQDLHSPYGSRSGTANWTRIHADCGSESGSTTLHRQYKGSSFLFYLNADPDPDLRSKTNAVPCRTRSRSWSDFEVKKMNFTWKIYLKQGIGQKSISTKVQKPFRKAGNPVYLIILVKFDAPGSACPIRIRIYTTAPDNTKRGL
jgi:hypothetical protein